MCNGETSLKKVISCNLLEMVFRASNLQRDSAFEGFAFNR